MRISRFSASLMVLKWLRFDSVYFNQVDTSVTTSLKSLHMVELRAQDSTSATRLKPSPVKVTSSKKPPLKAVFLCPRFSPF